MGLYSRACKSEKSPALHQGEGSGKMGVRETRPWCDAYLCKPRATAVEPRNKKWERLLNFGYIFFMKNIFNLEAFTVAVFQKHHVFLMEKLESTPRQTHTHAKMPQSHHPGTAMVFQFFSAYSIRSHKFYKLGIIFFSKLLGIF